MPRRRRLGPPCDDYPACCLHGVLKNDFQAMRVLSDAIPIAVRALPHLAGFGLWYRNQFFAGILNLPETAD